MQNTTTVFEKIFAGREWKPIRNCPGRFTLSGGTSQTTVNEIVGESLELYCCHSDKVPDEIIVTAFNDGGGIISYVKADNLFLHTLNDQDGFERKLRQLDIGLSENDRSVIRR